MYNPIIFTGLLLFVTHLACAQKKDSIGTQTVNIVKSYTPTLSDAFKVPETPVMNDSIIPQKKEIAYTIFSVPVASTFVPLTGDPLKMDALNKETLYNSYVSLELGNYATALLDFFTSKPLEKDTFLDVALHHHSSQGGIEEVVLEDTFYNSSLNVAYTKTDRDMDWKSEAGFHHQLYNWYGLYDPAAFPQNDLDLLEARQNYYNAQLKTSITLRNSFFKEGGLTLRRFWDTYGSAEYRAHIQPSLEFPIAGEQIHTTFMLDYLSGTFDREYQNETPIHYSNFVAGINPNLLILRDNIKVNLGATAVYASDPGTGEGDFFIYPRISAFYNIVKDNFIIYGGLEGELIQNNYYDIVAENTFVSPTLSIIPTNKQYDAYVGVKGKFSNNINYHLKGRYSIENNKPLLQLNPVAVMSNGESYAYGNSFGLLYDDIETLSLSGTVDTEVLDNLTMSLNTEFFNYRTETQPEAWNLPVVKATLSAQYTIGTHWYGNTHIFFTGARKDLLHGEGFLQPQTITADAYVDVNTHMGYRFNDRLSAFLKLNNLLNNEYNRWATYPIQGVQALLGASYRFNL